MSDLKTWNSAAASNTMAPPHGCPEGWNPNQVNDWGRETMAAIRRWYEDAQWIDYGHNATYQSSIQFKVPGNRASIYHANRRIRARVGTGTYYGYIASSNFADPDTEVVVTWDSGQLDASISGIAVGILSAQNGSLPRSGDIILSGGDHFVSSIGAARGSFNVLTANDAQLVHVDIYGGTISGASIIACGGGGNRFSGGSYSAGTMINCTWNGGTISGAVIRNSTIASLGAANVDGTTLSACFVKSPVIVGGTSTALVLYAGALNDVRINNSSAVGMTLTNCVYNGGTMSGVSLYHVNFNDTVSGTARFGVIYSEGFRMTRRSHFCEKTSGQHQTIADIATPTQVTFDKVRFASGGFGEYSSATSRLTPAIAGWYQMNASVRFQSGGINDQEEINVRIVKNGVTSTQGRIRASGALSQHVQVASLEFANGTTDYFEIQVNGGGSGQRIIDGLEGQTYWCASLT